MVKKAIIRFSGFLVISTMLFASQSFAMKRNKKQAPERSGSKQSLIPQTLTRKKLSTQTPKKKQPTPPPFPSPTRKPVLPEQSTRSFLERSKRAAPSKKSFNDQLWEMTNLGSTEGVEVMLAMGANPHYKINNSSPLLLACEKENAYLIKLFAQYAKLDITEYVDREWSPLLKAIEKNNPPFLEVLIQSHHNKDESFYAALGSALEQAHIHKKPAIFNYIAHKLPMEELICWFTIFSRRNSVTKTNHEQAKYHVYTVIRERLSQPALSQAELTGFERESQENSRNHAQHDNRLAFIEELRRHAFTTACSSAIKRETLEDARSLITKSEQTSPKHSADKQPLLIPPLALPERSSEPLPCEYAPRAHPHPREQDLSLNISGENSECESVETDTSSSLHSLDSMPEQPAIKGEEKEDEEDWELINREN